ncbi:MAG TPA: hypothetical protein VG325_07025 [Solirubrobacteraceae bacterium]|nr:hypothetical protein [Solirubrobacteraceae bacterium]
MYDIDLANFVAKMYFRMLQRLINRWPADRTVSRSPLDDGLGFTIRFAYPDDAAALKHLAALDSQPIPAGPLVVAEVAGELWAAVSLTGEPQAIADPFHHTAELVSLLQARASRLTRQGRHRIAPHPPATPAYR